MIFRLSKLYNSLLVQSQQCNHLDTILVTGRNRPRPPAAGYWFNRHTLQYCHIYTGNHRLATPSDNCRKLSSCSSCLRDVCVLLIRWGNWINWNEKSTRRRRKHCELAVVRRSQKFSPRRRSLSRGRADDQNLISWRWSLPAPTDPVWWGSMHAISSYRGNRPTHKQTHAHTNRQDR